MGLEIIKPGVNINFTRLRIFASVFSAILIGISFISLLIKGGPYYGIDFAGGTIMQLKFTKAITAAEIRPIIEVAGLKNIKIQRFGPADNNEYLIRTQTTTEALQRLSELVKETLETKLGKDIVEVRRAEMVGPKVGKDLREKALLALFCAILAIGIYISGRFEMKWGSSVVMGIVYIFSIFRISLSFLVILAGIVTLFLYVFLRLRFALGAVLAIIHDVFITVGIFSLLNKEIDLLIIATLLMIMGYSLNDTIIIFDRIRENMKKTTKENFSFLINRSINETLSRTILTSGTTFLTLFVLYLLGGSVIQNFALAMLIGVSVGTYSSIFIASPVLIVLEEISISKKFKNSISNKK
jgi:preprotein translocase subunit SecF